MNRFTKQFGFAFATTVFIAATALSQTPAPSAVGMINFQRAVTQNDDGVKAANTYTAEGQKLAEGLKKSQAKVQDLQDQLSKGGATMTDAAKNALIRDIDKEKKVFDLEQQNAQSSLDDRQEELFRPVADRVRKVVEAYAKELNLAVVVNATDDMLYANDVTDITTEIIRRVNADIVKNPAKPK
ncbi:MAG TPA: OmpH family outer membrane protein [Terriglobia bacterium]|nr:OmpH family outer membrane protein [Terriglobia bacterium]